MRGPSTPLRFAQDDNDAVSDALLPLTDITSFVKSLTTIIAAALAVTASAAENVTYNDHVLPIFRNACLNCHNPDKKKAGLDLSTYQNALQGSENGKILESGNPGGSLLFKCIKQTEDPKMPPKGDKLSDKDIAVIENWIAGQLLETTTGKAVAAASNNVKVAVVSLERPSGPPPMPGELPLEPFVQSSRKNAVTALAASPWAPLVAIGGQKQIVLYNTETLEPLGVLPFPEGFPAVVRFSRNGQVLLTGGGQGGKSGKVVLWDIKTGERIGTIGNEFDQVLGADLSADQQFVALGGPSKLVKIYATKDGKLVQSIKKHTDWVMAVAYSPDGKLLASADRNGGIQIWEGDTGKEFNSLPGHKVTVTSLAFMTGVVASASEDGTVKLWDVKEGKEIKSWTAHAGGVEWVEFTPDGRLVSCGRDKIAKVWDQTGKMLGQTEAFGDIALRATLSNDRVIAGDWNGDIRVCSLDGKRIGELSATPPAIAERLGIAQKVLAEARAAAVPLQQQYAAAEQQVKAEKDGKVVAPAAPAPAPELAKAAELTKTLESQTAEVAKLREARATKKEGTPEYAEADAKVQAKKGEIAKTQASLDAGKASPAPTAAVAPVAAKPSAAEETFAKAKAALDQANGQVTGATATVEKWTRAQAFMTVHTAKQTLADKQAVYEGLVAAAKDALTPAEQARNDLAALEKAVAEAPAQVQEKQALLGKAQQALDPLTKAIVAGEAALVAKEAQTKSATEAFDKATSSVAELSKKLEQDNAEQVKLREARGKLGTGTPEYAAADAKVQAQKPVIAATEAALAAANAKVAELKPQTETPRAEIAKMKEALEKSRADVKAAAAVVAPAEKALTDARKSADEMTRKLAKLRKDVPEIVTSAKAAKIKAEQDAAAAAKDLQATKAQAERVRAEFEKKWQPLPVVASAGK